MTCFSKIDFFFTNLRLENSRAGANTGFWRFSAKIGVLAFNRSNRIKKLPLAEKSKKSFFGKIDYTLLRY